MQGRVVVVGGGIAGIAAALRLSESGVTVTLLETRRKLGGRATSFHDVRTGEVIDNCQHIALACCTTYLDLCRRLGVLDAFRWHEDIFWVEPGGRTSVMKPGPVPPPCHYAGSVLRAAFLSLGEKRALARAMKAVRQADRSKEMERTFGAWLRGHDQPERLIRRFWSPVVVSACNLDVDRVAAGTALHVFQDGFLAGRRAAAMGVSRVPLVRLYDRAEEAVRAAGGMVRLGTGVERIRSDRVLTTSGETIVADAVVLAVPPERAHRMVDEQDRAADPRFDAAARITHSPILGVHLVFDRPVLRTHSAVLVDRPTQWLFRKDDAGQKIHAVISAADSWIPLNEDEITQRVMQDIRACIPAARAARILSSRPIKEKLATFAATPQNEALRPRATGPSGIILAGDWVQTGWPATMEGATISGYAAAEAALASLKSTQREQKE